MGENTNPALRLQFDRRPHLEFRDATITSDDGLLACHELDDVLRLTETAIASSTAGRPTSVRK